MDKSSILKDCGPYSQSTLPLSLKFSLISTLFKCCPHPFTKTILFKVTKDFHISKFTGHFQSYLTYQNIWFCCLFLFFGSFLHSWVFFLSSLCSLHFPQPTLLKCSRNHFFFIDTDFLDNLMSLNTIYMLIISKFIFLF
jgi:hypothetical protein